MIYLHRLLPLLLSPIVVFCFIFVFGTIKRKRAVALTGIIFLYVLSTPLVANQLYRRCLENNEVKKTSKDLPNADAIVVLSGMLINVPASQGTVKEWGDPDRFFGGIELYKLGKSRKLIFTGGVLPWDKDKTPEGVILKEYAESMNVPEKDIVVTDNVQNTDQEASAVRKLLNKDKPSILLVTSAYHMPRAKFIFENKGFVVYPYSVDFQAILTEITPMDFLPNAGALSMTDVVIREQIGRMYYRIMRSSFHLYS